MNIRNITDGISYVGVNDRTTHRFEALWPLPAGVSYNSYVVKGSSKTALIDGVEISECDKLLTNIREIAGTETPDYLVINHMEPDHSGSIKVLRSFFPEMTIVGNAKTLEMVKGFYGIEDNLLKVADNYTVDLGGLTLTFKLTPMVHWPETMMTYVNERNVLFSGDGFGCFGAINGGVIDSETDVEYYIPEMYRYYSNIVGKYGTPVQNVLKKAAGLDIQYLCPLHGPVWRENIGWFLEKYKRWSTYTPEAWTAAIFCGSIYGHTENACEILASRLAEKGVRHVRIFDVSHTDVSEQVSAAFQCSHLVFASATYNGGIYTPMETLLLELKAHALQNRTVALIENGSWGPAAARLMAKHLEEMKGMEQIAQEGAIQIFREVGGGMEEVVVGVVGVLQLEVLEYRLNTEYNVEIRMQQLPFEQLRWVKNDPDTYNLRDLDLTSDTKAVEDMKGNRLLLFTSDWAVRWAETHNETLELSEFGNI